MAAQAGGQELELSSTMACGGVLRARVQREVLGFWGLGVVTGTAVQAAAESVGA